VLHRGGIDVGDQVVKLNIGGAIHKPEEI